MRKRCRREICVWRMIMKMPTYILQPILPTAISFTMTPIGMCLGISSESIDSV